MKILSALLLLLLLACDGKRPEPPDSRDSTLPGDTITFDTTYIPPRPDTTATLPETLAVDSPPVLEPDTAPADTTPSIPFDSLRLDTLTVVDTTIDTTAVVVVDDSIRPDTMITPPIEPEPVKLGIPSGPFYLSLSPCGQPYSGTLIVAGPTLKSDLAKARNCKLRVVVAIPRKVYYSGKTASGADTGLSVSKAAAFLRTLDSAAVTQAIADGTLFAFYTGDDVNGQLVGKERANEWGKASYNVKLARWDAIAGEVKKLWPDAITTIRALPTQLVGITWRHMDAAQVQYTGPRRHGRIQDFISTQVATAKSLKLGLLLGFNALDGGCGPPHVQPSDPAKRCPPGITGTGLYGTTTDTTSHRYQTTAAEVIYYKTHLLAEAYSCGSIDWRDSRNVLPTRLSPQYVKVRAYHTRPDIVAAAKTLLPLARNREATSCIHPDRR